MCAINIVLDVRVIATLLPDICFLFFIKNIGFIKTRIPLDKLPPLPLFSPDIIEYYSHQNRLAMKLDKKSQWSIRRIAGKTSINQGIYTHIYIYMTTCIWERCKQNLLQSTCHNHNYVCTNSTLWYVNRDLIEHAYFRGPFYSYGLHLLIWI